MAADLTRVARVLGMLGPVAAEVGAEMVTANVAERTVEVAGPVASRYGDMVRAEATRVRLHVYGYDAGQRLAARLGLPETSREVHGGGDKGWGPTEHVEWRSVVVLDAGVLADVEVLALRDVEEDSADQPGPVRAEVAA